MKNLQILVLTFLQVVAYSQYYPLLYSPSVVDGRSSAMGRTSIISAKSSNAIFSNPALIANLDKPQYNFGGRFIMGSVLDESSEDEYNIYDFEYTPHFAISHVSYSKPYQIEDSDMKLSLGFGYRTFFDWGMKSEKKYGDGVGIHNESFQNNNGGLNVISVSLAKPIGENSFFGITYNKSIKAISGSIELLTSGRNENFDDTISYKDKTEIKHSVSFWQFGFYSIVSPKLSFGALFRPEFEWEWDIIKNKRWENGDLVNQDSESGNIITIPSTIGVAFLYNLSRSFLISGEYQTRNFSDFIFDYEESFFDDGGSYRIGVELQRKTVLRVGMFNDAIPITDEDEDKPKSLIGFTGGIAINIGNSILDVFIENSYWSYVDDQNWEYKENIYRVGLSINYVFPE